MTSMKELLTTIEGNLKIMGAAETLNLCII